MFVVGSGNVEVATADVIDGFVVDEECAISMLDRTVRRQHGIVRLDNGRRDLGRRIDSKLQLAFLTVVDRKPLEQEGAKARAGSSAKGMEDEEALQRRAVV